jgi:Nucleotidyl transferase AbiEii toxin, Type IV TA system
MPVQEVHERQLHKSAQLSSFQVAMAIPPLGVVRVLNAAKIAFVLVGAYGLAGWRKEPRATEDVDVVVAARHVKKAVKVLLEAFTHLEAVDLPVVVRLRERGTEDVVIDVMKPVQQPYRELFKHTHAVHSQGQTYRVPSLEMAIVMKFSAMTSLYRAEEDKHQDAHDFILMVKKNPDFDRDKLADLGSLIYPDGGKHVVELARKAWAGERLLL